MDIYNVDSYTEQELIEDVLELNRPTDGELEARLQQLLRKYASNLTRENARLYLFFNDVYDRLFHPETGYEEGVYKSDGQEEEEAEEEEEVEEEVEEEDTSWKGRVGKDDDMKMVSRAQRINVTKAVDVVKGKVNPLLLQTVRRVISVDSKDRNTGNPSEFSFELSEPLKDVVVLRLYSVGIPYTWYTINTSFGSNFILIRGKSPGIESNVIKIELTPGNYTASELAVSSNASFQTALEGITDISFGTSDITYNSNTSKTTINFAPTKAFSAGSYYFEFTNWTSPTGTRTDSVPAFLGFNKQQYYLNEISSLDTLPDILNAANDQQSFILTDTNKVITLKHFSGPGDFTSSTPLLGTYTLTLPLAAGTYSRNQLQAGLQSALLAATFLSTSSQLTRHTTQYQLQLHFDRNEVLINKDSRIRVEFPVDTTVTAAQRIWVGAVSAFRFAQSEYTVSDTLSEFTAVSDTVTLINIAGSPYFEIKCIKPGYVSSFNDYRGTLTDTPLGGGVGPTTVLAQMNQVLDTLKTASITPYDPTGEIHPTNSKFILENDANISFSLDINKSFTEKKYTASVVGTFLDSVMGLDNDPVIDLSENNVLSSTFSTNVIYTLDTSLVLTVAPIQPHGHSDNHHGAGNSGAAPYIINIEDYVVNGYVGPSDASYAWSGTTPRIIFRSFDKIAPFFNYLFDNFTDSDGEKPLNGTALTITSLGGGILSAELSISVLKVLQEPDFTLQFVDTRYAGTDPLNIWTGEMNFDNTVVDSSLVLVNTTTSISTGTLTTDPLDVNTIIIGENVGFNFRAWETGVTAANNENDQEYIIPEGSYTRTQLINAMNQVVGQTIFTVDNEYVKLNPAVSKEYKAQDYELVLFDEVAFVQCYTGVSSVRNATSDATLGWILGFREYTNYAFTSETLVSDATVVTGLYNKLFIIIDDFNQSRLNDGLVTNASSKTTTALPSYGTRNQLVCSAVTNEQVFDMDQPTSTRNRLTESQIFAFNAIAEDTAQQVSDVEKTPMAKDVFAVIPILTNTLQSGDVYTQFGGTLQDQERVYFGPVNIRRMSVKLMTDRGDPIDLNGSNWSFSLIAEQLYQSSTQ